LLWKEQSSGSSSKAGRRDIIPLFFNYKNTHKETAQLFMTRTAKASSACKPKESYHVGSTFGEALNICHPTLKQLKAAGTNHL